MANRSQIFSNWRAKAQPPSNIEQPNLENGNPQDYNANSEAFNRKIPPNIPPNASYPAEIRGEDDPRTLQAIAEGRRLYVGNLPYMAKTEDIQDLFVSNNYQMYAKPNPLFIISNNRRDPSTNVTILSVHT